MNKSYEIGKIISVDGMKVEIELYDNLSTSQYLTIDAKIFEIGGVGNYLKTKKLDGELIIEILSEYATDLSYQPKKEDSSIRKPNVSRIIKGKIKGKLFNDDKYNMGIYDSPMVFDTVYLAEEKDVEKIYISNARFSELCIGKVVLNENINFAIDINSFFASHIAILGNTGSGKSNTLACLYEKLLNQKNSKGIEYINTIKGVSKFLIIDTNGEYKSAFTDNREFKKIISLAANKTVSNTLRIPIMCTDDEDWGIMLNATDRTQQPIIAKCFGDLKKLNNYVETIDVIENKVKTTLKKILNSNKTGNQKQNSINSLRELTNSYLKGAKFKDYISYTTLEEIFNFEISYGNLTLNGVQKVEDIIALTDPKKFLIENLSADKATLEFLIGIEEIDFFLNLNYQYNVNSYDINENFVGPMLSRFNSMKNSFSNIFCESSLESKGELVNLLFGESSFLILDVSKLSTKLRIALTSLISNKLYKYYENLDKRNNQSLHIIIDEAHNYLNSKNIENEDKMSLKSLELYEKIIKEGRKFGVYLTISSQRPADISPTILSQCHNYVIHRLANPNDINQIYNVVSFIDSKSIDMLPILAPGQAIFSGTSFSSPTLVKVEFPKHRVDSENTDLTNLWTNTPIDID